MADQLKTHLESVVDYAFAPVMTALAEQEIPGAALGVITKAGTRAVRWSGYAAWEPAKEELARGHFFDLASLTKTMVTLREILQLVEEGQVDLDDPLSLHLDPQGEILAPHLGFRLGQQSLRRLLTHQTGLPPTEPLYHWPGPSELRKERLLTHVWDFGVPLYSDINYIFLGLIIEKYRNCVFADLPVGEELSFHPTPKECVATEACFWRGYMLRGEVMDQNAAALGGAAGHAGLFGTVDGVLSFALKLLQKRLLSPASHEIMCQRHTPTRALGWETPFARWTGGSLCSPGTIGHLGFTGTGLWVDLERDLAWCLLTNRVHPNRVRTPSINKLRRSVANRICARFTRM